MSIPTFLLGRRSGSLTIVAFWHRDARGHDSWWAVCDCRIGRPTRLTPVRQDHFLSGRVTSCGCRRVPNLASGGATASSPLTCSKSFIINERSRVLVLKAVNTAQTTPSNFPPGCCIQANRVKAELTPRTRGAHKAHTRSVLSSN